MKIYFCYMNYCNPRCLVAFYLQSNICCSIKEHQHCEGNSDHKRPENIIGTPETLRQKRQCLFLDGSIVSAKICTNILSADHPWQRSPFHSKPIFHLLHSVVLGPQQLFGSLLSDTVEPRLVQLSHAGVILWQQGALCPVELLHFLEKLLWVLSR